MLRFFSRNEQRLSCKADHLETGAVAQLGERFNGIEEVEGSNPSSSTNKLTYQATAKSVAW